MFLTIQLRVVNKKRKETRDHAGTHEEGFQRLQETFRTTVLDSLDADAQLTEKNISLEGVVDSLTILHCGDTELDALARHVPKMNPLHFGQSSESKADDTSSSPPPRQGGQSILTSLKRPEHSLSSSVKRKAKFQRKRRERKRGHVHRTWRGDT